MHRTLSLLVILTVGSILSHAAEPPPLMNYQGVLRDANDEPLTGAYDIQFRFFDASAAGGEILIDAHTGANAVQVEGGLFSVGLGSGAVSDGAAVYPADPYLSLADVFRDFSEVWIEIEIAGEMLSPRTRVLSAAYALNASQLGGFAPGNFVDTTAVAQTKEGKLTVGGLDVDGSVTLLNEFFAVIQFGTGEEFGRIAWDFADDRFELNKGLQLPASIQIGDPSDFPVAYNRFSEDTYPNGSGFDNDDDLFLGGNLEADGSAFFSGEIFVDNDGPDGDQHLWFFNNGAPDEELKWDETAERFEFSDALAIAGALRTGQTQGAPEAFNHLGDLGKSPGSDDMGGPQDLYVEGDVEIEERLYINRELVMLDLGPDIDGDGSPDDVNQWIFFYDEGRMDDEWIEWENDAGGGVDRFEFSDSVHVFGDLSALNKNFVQNHPYRDDLEVVYTTLEGSEAAVFTRGHARLVGGEARVALEESFAWVASPELGLTAQLTPRGSYAELFVVSLTPEELLVRAASTDAAAQDAAFDYVVHGLRLGYENQPVVRPRSVDAPLPRADAWAGVYASVPEAAALRPQARFEAMSRALPPVAGSAALAEHARDLRAAIGQRDREEPRRPDRSSDSGRDGVDPHAPAEASTLPAPAPRPDNRMEATAAVAPTTLGSDSLRARSFRAERQGIAGRFPADEPVSVGDVVVLTLDASGKAAVRRTDRVEDPTVVGVAADEAGVVFAPTGDDLGGTGVTVAMSGIVPCKVDASYGSILPGDLLVTSPTPGYAMRSAQPLPGTVVGKALEPLPEGQGTITVLVFQR